MSPPRPTIRATQNSNNFERFRYTPYGESEALDDGFVKKSSWFFGDFDWTYRYTSRELDPKTVLQLNRNRWYHQQLGRRTSRDLIGYGGARGISTNTQVVNLEYALTRRAIKRLGTDFLVGNTTRHSGTTKILCASGAPRLPQNDAGELQVVSRQAIAEMNCGLSG